jgi:hypothetical protein
MQNIPLEMAVTYNFPFYPLVPRRAKKSGA